MIATISTVIGVVIGVALGMWLDMPPTPIDALFPIGGGLAGYIAGSTFRD